jgi:hypothetical protein
LLAKPARIIDPMRDLRPVTPVTKSMPTFNVGPARAGERRDLGRFRGLGPRLFWQTSHNHDI